jgi:hypothetical protein
VPGSRLGATSYARPAPPAAEAPSRSAGNANSAVGIPGEAMGAERKPHGLDGEAQA